MNDAPAPGGFQWWWVAVALPAWGVVRGVMDFLVDGKKRASTEKQTALERMDEREEKREERIERLERKIELLTEDLESIRKENHRLRNAMTVLQGQLEIAENKLKAAEATLAKAGIAIGVLERKPDS